MNRIKHLRFALVIMLLVGCAFAVPIRPDLGKILKQQDQRNRHFEPAQAGWNGPEMQRVQDVSPNPVLEAYGPAATARSIRAALTAAAIPDPKAAVAIAVLIILMRIMKQVQDRRKAEVVPIRSALPDEERKAA